MCVYKCGCRLHGARSTHRGQEVYSLLSWDQGIDLRFYCENFLLSELPAGSKMATLKIVTQRQNRVRGGQPQIKGPYFRAGETAQCLRALACLPEDSWHPHSSLQVSVTAVPGALTPSHQCTKSLFQRDKKDAEGVTLSSRCLSHQG